MAVVTLSQPEEDSVRSVLMHIYEHEGALTPQAVLEHGTDPDSVLHGFFEWDDSEAARRFRLSQAGELIRRCKITVQTGPEEVRRVRAFTHVAPRASYVPTEKALVESRDVVLQQCLRDISALRRKYADLVDFDVVLRQSLGQQEAA